MSNLYILPESRLHQQMMEWYRHFHRYPELSMQERNTTKKLKEILLSLGAEIQHDEMEVGVVACLEGSASGPEVVLRADIDALPITEQSDLPFRSTVETVSHMCGHDFHMASLLGAASYLSENRHRWRGKVKMLFQPGEETTTGAKYMMEHHVLHGNEVAIYGLHNAPHIDLGKVGIRKGPFFASADTLHIIVKGQKGHAALPHLTKDATVAASAIVMGLQTLVSRETNPLSPAVVTIGSLHSGQGHNVISDRAEMWGTMRTFEKATREHLSERLPQLVQDIARGYGCDTEVQVLPQTPAVYNDEKLTEQWIQNVAQMLSHDHIVEANQIMAAEDFAIFQEKIPGCYFLVGTRDETRGIIHHWHDPKFRANEQALPTAASLFVMSVFHHLAS